MKKEKYYVIGVMAGSSMDGLDVVKACFIKSGDDFSFEIIHAETVEYSQAILSELQKADKYTNDEKTTLDTEFGNWIGKTLNRIGHFRNTDLIAVHGHTVEHDPAKGISWQLGSGQAISQLTKCTTITDFRTLDISLGGQGAPLVPFADYMLFSEYEACLNLGGICNISLRNERKAWDISPCNQVLNYFSKQLGFTYDPDGALAKKGKFNKELYERLNEIDYFHKTPPKSLPNNFINSKMLDSTDPMDGLQTYTQFISDKISNELERYAIQNVLVTGGGAHNQYLIDLIQTKTSCSIDVPDPQTIDFKEALIFAFLGLKRIRNEINVLSSVTGASKDSSSGVIHFPE